MTQSANDQLAALGLSLTSEHIPLRGSLDLKTTMVDFRVTVAYNGRGVIATEYHMGLGHCKATSKSKRPAPNLSRLTLDYFRCLESTLRGLPSTFMDDIRWTLPEPTLADVLSSLLLDSEVLGHPSFESWADEYGYDPDSRRAEATYRACMDTTLRVTNGIPRDVLDAARDVLADY